MKKALKRGVVALLKTLARFGLIKEHREQIRTGEVREQVVPFPDVETSTMRFKVEMADNLVFYEHRHGFSTRGGMLIYTVSKKRDWGRTHKYMAAPTAFRVEYNGQSRWVEHGNYVKPRLISLVDAVTETVEVDFVEIDVSQNYYYMAMAIGNVPDHLIAELMDVNYKKFSGFLKKQPIKGRKDGVTSER